MPRLGARNYLTRYCQLSGYWSTNHAVFRLLAANDQWALHDFFRFSDSLPEPALIAHRRRVTRADPSLPHRAGRAYAKLERRMAQVDWMAYGQTPTQPITRSRAIGSARRISIHSVVRPDVDIQRIADALITQILRDAQREADNEAEQPAA